MFEWLSIHVSFQGVNWQYFHVHNNKIDLNFLLAIWSDFNHESFIFWVVNRFSFIDLASQFVKKSFYNFVYASDT